MFYLSELEHKLRLPPHLLILPLDEAIESELKALFLDKVIPKLGLCISIHDLKSIDGGFVLHSEGAPTYNVVFRVIVFRPFPGEVISAKLKESTKDGLQLTLGFFDDIHVSSCFLPQPSVSEPELHSRDAVRWYWVTEDDKLPIDEDEEIRFRVLTVDYPSIPLEQEPNAKPFAPMVVQGSLIDEGGLGPISWWS